MLFAINLVLIACSDDSASPNIPQKPKSELQIGRLLDDWHTAAAEANFDLYFVFMDSVSVYIGTDASENWTKEQFAAFSKPYFDKGKAWSFKAIQRNIYFSQEGAVCWFDELLDTWMGTCRGSGVVELTNGIWKLKHYVLSVAIPNESIREVIEIKEPLDSLFRSTVIN